MTDNTSLQEKNNFVISLRDYLMESYGTDKHYTFGEGDFEGRMDDNGSSASYSLVRRDPNKPRDISGFCFRKDLCMGFSVPSDDKKILMDIQEFSEKKKIKNELIEHKIGDRDINYLKIIIAGKEYMISAYIDDGYAGEMDVYFTESPIIE